MPFTDYSDNPSSEQKQRVAVASQLRFALIARALVSHPKLVLADEPTAALEVIQSRCCQPDASLGEVARLHDFDGDP